MLWPTVCLHYILDDNVLPFTYLSAIPGDDAIREHSLNQLILQSTLKSEELLLKRLLARACLRAHARLVCLGCVSPHYDWCARVSRHGILEVITLRMGGLEFVGRVVSNRMQKTVVVAVSYVVWIPKYKVYQKRVSRHKARDDSQSLVIGDIVRIRKSRKFSKEVSYAVVETLRRAHVYDAEAAAALVSARDASRATDFVRVAEQRLAEAGARLAKLREMYEKELGGGVSLSGGVLAVSNSGPQGTGSLAPGREKGAAAVTAIPTAAAH